MQKFHWGVQRLPGKSGSRINNQGPNLRSWIESDPRYLILHHSSRSEEVQRPSERSEVYKFVAWGSRKDRLGRSNFDLPIYISMVSAQLPSNKTKSQPLTVVHSHVSSVCFFISCLLCCVHLGADMFIHRL